MRRHMEQQPDEDGFFQTAIRGSDIVEGGMQVVEVGDGIVIVTRHKGRLLAFSNICPHAAADLRQGRLKGGTIKCAEHGYTFSLDTGRATWPEGEGCRLMRYTVMLEQGFVKIKLRVPEGPQN